jgi:hypothetical protein
MHNEKTKKPKFAIAAPIVAAMLLATTAISMTTTENAFAGKYENNQATSTSNSCLNPLFDTSTVGSANTIGNCGNTVSQQEEAGQASSPITHQVASPTIGEQAPSPPEQEPQTCNQCFFTFLTPDEINTFEETLSDITEGQVTSVVQACLLLEATTPEELPESLNTIAVALQLSGIDESTIAEIIDCLERVLGV